MTSSQAKPRVAWVAIQPTPYVMPLFDSLKRSGKVDIHFFFSTTKGQLPWSVKRYEDLIAPESHGWTLPIGRYHYNPRVVRAMITEPWDAVVLQGYAVPTHQLAILSCLVRRIPFIVQSDTRLVKPRHVIKRALKRMLLFPIIRRCGSAMGLGKQTKLYWQYVGIPKERIFIVPFTPHLDHFRSESIRQATHRAEIRRELGIPVDGTLGISVGRLVPVKGLDVLLRGLALVEPAGRPHVLLVGDGPDREMLQKMVTEHSLPVTFAGFRQNEELPALYAAADFFLLPSRLEAWGVVAAEAMASGLPIVLSDQVGSLYDLLEEEQNGFLIKAGSAEDCRDVLQRCVREKDTLKAMGERSREIVRDMTLEHSTRQALNAIEAALAGKGKHLAGDPDAESPAAEEKVSS